MGAFAAPATGQRFEQIGFACGLRAPKVNGRGLFWDRVRRRSPSRTRAQGLQMRQSQSIGTLHHIVQLQRGFEPQAQGNLFHSRNNLLST